MANNKEKEGYGWNYTMKNETKNSGEKNTKQKTLFFKTKYGLSLIMAEKAQIMCLMGLYYTRLHN